ncbi:unnamed protein product [Lota lota]
MAMVQDKFLHVETSWRCSPCPPTQERPSDLELWCVAPPRMTAPPPPPCLALRLHTSEDPNGHAFASSCCSSCSSCCSSCSSSSLPGEVSPDSPSGPSGEGGADGRMLEVAVATAAARNPEEDGGTAGAWPDEASLSLYLDAHTGRTWSDRNHNLLVAVETHPGLGRHGDHAGDDLSAGRGCSSPDSDATEIPADDDDDDDDDEEAGEEESLFLSVSSELSLESSSRTQPSPPTPDQPRRATAPVSTATKPANQEARRVRRPDLKNIKAKVVSRPAPAAKPSNQRQLAPANQRRAVPRKEEVQVSGEKGQRSSTGGVKMRPSPCRSVQSEERRSTLANRTLSGSSRSDLGSEVAEVLPVANGVTTTAPDTPLRQVSAALMTSSGGNIKP